MAAFGFAGLGYCEHGAPLGSFSVVGVGYVAVMMDPSAAMACKPSAISNRLSLRTNVRGDEVEDRGRILLSP
jgi:hypothetical protein